MVDKKGVIIISYRDRQTHLDVLLMYLNKYFHLPIIVAEQADKEKWNKGLLYNAAFEQAGTDYDYIVYHDVDFVPARSVDYSYTANPTLVATECSQFNYGSCYEGFFGGVVGISTEHYKLINGFSNQFRGYGGEDDLLFQSCIAKGLSPVKRLGNRFECFVHPKPNIRPGSSYYSSSDYQKNLRLATSPRDFSEGLSTSEYSVISDTRHSECRHLRIKTTK